MNQNPMPSSWWSLHLRVAKGETLSESEKTEYETHRAHFDSLPEQPSELIAQVLHARLRMSELSRESDILNHRLETLLLEKQRLEAKLSESTRKKLTAVG